MPKSTRNCRDLKMETIRLRREKPSSTAIAIALAITMLIVYILSLQGTPKSEAAASVQSSAQLRMEGMKVDFLLSGLHDDQLQANVAAAQCARSGGAGLVLREGERFAVVYEAGKDFSDAEAPVIHRSAGGLTLKIDAPADKIGAFSDAIAILRVLAEETAALPAALESGGTDAKTVSALLGVYRTQLQSAQAGLSGTNASAAALFSAALAGNLDRVEAALAAPDPGKIRLIHAAACAEWISLVSNLSII